MPHSSHPTPASGTGNASSTSPGSVGLPGLGRPAMQHRFIIRVESTPKEFSEQMVACAINMVAKEFALLVEQSVTSPTREHVVIQDWINNPKRLVTLEVCDTSGVVMDTIKFIDSEIIDHNVDFNYANVGAVVHVIGAKYDKIDLGSGKAQSAYNSAMSVVGRP